MTTLIAGLRLDLQALLLREPEMESLQPAGPTQTFLGPCWPSQIAQNSLEGPLGLLTSIPFQPKVSEISFGLGSVRAEVENIPWRLLEV